MKKILAITLSLVMTLGLFAGCANSSDNTAPNNAAQSNSGSTTPSDSTPANVEGDNEGTNPADVTTPTNGASDETPSAEYGEFTTVTEGKLTMATNAFFPPYEYYEGETIVGIDAEIAAAIAEKLGLELVITNMEFDSIITAVTTGAADMGLAGMTVTEERLEQVDFSIPYASGVQSIIVKEDSAITSVDDLSADGATYKVGVQLGTTGDIYASDDFGAERVTQYNNGNSAVLALQSGDVDCVIIDNEPAKAFVAANEGLKILDTAYAEEDYAACFNMENKDLRTAVDTAIEELIMDGTIDAIIEKYIPANA